MEVLVAILICKLEEEGEGDKTKYVPRSEHISFPFLR